MNSSPSLNSGNETILFSENEAYDLLVDVQDEKTKLQQKKENSSVTKAKQNKQSNHIAKKPGKNNKIFWIVVGLVILVSNLGLGGFFFYSHKKEQQTINRNAKAVKQFIHNHEANRSSRANNNKEINSLKEILSDIKISYQVYPDAERLSLLQAKVEFLIFERKFKALINNKQIDKSNQLVKTIRKTLNKLKKRVSENSKNAKEIVKIADLLEIADIIIKFKYFQEQYPDANRTSRHQPSVYQLKELKREKSRFVAFRKQKNTLLSTQYPYFKALMIKTYKDFNLIYEWERVLN